MVRDRADGEVRWRRIAGRWPGVEAPTVEIIGLDDALCEPHLLSGGVALVLAGDDPAGRACVPKLLDVLDARMTPAVALTDEPGALAGLPADRVIALPASARAEIVASSLYALCARQPAVEALLAELRTVKRFHGGLQDQMDRLQEELQLAAHVQRQFIPRSLPEIDGLEFGLVFRPCGYVSGDIYDVARIDDRLTGFFVADAVGHGVPAALMTMVLSKAMPTLDEDGAVVGPAESLRRLNASLMRRTGRVQTFATAVCGVIDARTGVVTLAGAGHPPPLRLGPAGVRKIETEGCLLGVFDDGLFNEVSFRLEPEEVLVIHSDGFETAFPEDGASSAANDRYLEHLAAVRDGRERFGIDAAMDRLGRTLDQQSGSLHQLDDQTALAIARARPLSARSAA
ncbi:MAG: hypothetical protein D6693_03960 [Planctomycetota bacterium]|nr:MAG: hypothetical protein D6693_03960 [Planctomycetota bacterium]